jgi:prophage regulatory protein
MMTTRSGHTQKSRKRKPTAISDAVKSALGSRIEGPSDNPLITRVGVLPENGFLRLSQIVGDRKAKPPVPGIIPVGVSTWWAGVKSGRFPKPHKLGPRTTAWSTDSIRELLAQINAREAA